MKIIKRNGVEMLFDPMKIFVAVQKASDAVEKDNPGDGLTTKDIMKIASNVTDICEKFNRAVTVEEVQDMVEDQLLNYNYNTVAKAYIKYRYHRALARDTSSTDDKILSLIECNNEEVKQENSNKNPVVNSVQRDYMAGEISKDLTNRLLLPPDILL